MDVLAPVEVVLGWVVVVGAVIVGWGVGSLYVGGIHGNDGLLSDHGVVSALDSVKGVRKTGLGQYHINIMPDMLMQWAWVPMWRAFRPLQPRKPFQSQPWLA